MCFTRLVINNVVLLIKARSTRDLIKLLTRTRYKGGNTENYQSIIQTIYEKDTYQYAKLSKNHIRANISKRMGRK